MSREGCTRNRGARAAARSRLRSRGRIKGPATVVRCNWTSSMHPATDRLARVAHYASPAPRDLRMRRRKAHLRSPKRRPRCVVRRPRNRLCSLGESERVRRGCSDDRVPDRQVPADQSTSPVSAEGNGGFFYYFPPVLGTAPRDASGGQFAVDLYEMSVCKKGKLISQKCRLHIMAC